MGLPLASAIFCIFDNLSVLPVARYKKDNLSKLFVFWYAFSTIYVKLSVLELYIGKEIRDLMVTLLEGLLSKTVPAIWPVDRLRCFNRHVKVPALDSKFESGVRVLHEMESNLKDRLSGRVVMAGD